MTDTHDTTPQADMPRLNPPETAPKDGTRILADFGYDDGLRMAVYSRVEEIWHTATGRVRYGEAWTETGWEMPEKLVGWLSWPEAPR